jgi:hypothetical protein
VLPEAVSGKLIDKDYHRLLVKKPASSGSSLLSIDIDSTSTIVVARLDFFDPPAARHCACNVALFGAGHYRILERPYEGHKREYLDSPHTSTRPEASITFGVITLLYCISFF